MSIVILVKLAAPAVGALGMLVGLLFWVRVGHAEAELHNLEQLEAQQAEAHLHELRVEEGAGELQALGENGELKIEVKINGAGAVEIIPAEPEPAEE